MEHASDRRVWTGRMKGGARALAVAAALLLVPAFLLPLWTMTMFAPQYQDGLRLHIYAARLDGGRGGQDVREINMLNHYIGMRELSSSDFPEFRWLPAALLALGVIIVLAAVYARPAGVLAALLLYGGFGVFALQSFAGKMYAYGHDLAPTAAVKVPGFMPPMFGYKQMANFEVYSYPAAAAYALVAVAALLTASLVLGVRQASKAAA